MTQVLNPDPADKSWRVTVAVTLYLYALLQFLYVTATPLEVMTLPDSLPRSAPQSLTVGIGPDEREHFLYALSLANRGELPRPAPRWRTSPEQYVTYQAQHPPVFYAVEALLLKATPGLSPSAAWYVLRGFCALCGGVVIVLAALAARAAFPDRPIIGFAAAPFVAFLPMFGHIMGNLSNEPLAMALTAWAWLQMVWLARGRSPLSVRTAALLGVTLGVAAETRMTAVMWFPAALLILGYAGRRSSTRPLLPIAAFLLCFFALTVPWFLHNQILYGAPVLRPFDRPMLQGHSLAVFLADPGFPTVARLTALWYASTAWTPFWLTQFYWPGGVRQEGGWQSLFLLADVFALLALFLHGSRAKREATPPDPAGRALLWAAGMVVLVCVLTLLQQQLYSDWDVLYSPGRYLVAAIPASSLLFLFAWAMLFRRARSPWPAVAGLTLLLLAFDLYSVSQVRQFYVDHPAQAAVQHFE